MPNDTHLNRVYWAKPLLNKGYLLPIAVLVGGSRQRLEMIIMDINGLKGYLPLSRKKQTRYCKITN